MASTDAPQAHPAPPSRPVPLHRLVRILRTRGVEPAIIPQERRNPSLIESNQKQQETAHNLPLSGLAVVSGLIGVEKRCSTKETGNGTVDLNVRCLPNRGSGNNDAIPPRLNLVHAQSYRFSHSPLHTIPHYRIAYAATYGKTKAAIGKAIL